jgi:hypothetical protein
MLRKLSTTLPAASLALGLLAFSGHLSSANAEQANEQANTPWAKIYASLTSPGRMPATSAQEMPRVEVPAYTTRLPYPPAEEGYVLQHPTAP